jgi:hypothetical protein
MARQLWKYQCCGPASFCCGPASDPDPDFLFWDPDPDPTKKLGQEENCQILRLQKSTAALIFEHFSAFLLNKYAFNKNESKYCKDNFASILQTFVSNNEYPVSDPEQQALAADPDPAKWHGRQQETPQFQGLPPTFIRKMSFKSAPTEKMVISTQVQIRINCLS